MLTRPNYLVFSPEHSRIFILVAEHLYSIKVAIVNVAHHLELVHEDFIFRKCEDSHVMMLEQTQPPVSSYPLCTVGNRVTHDYEANS